MDYLTDEELIRAVMNDEHATARELELAERLGRALDEVEDLEKEIIRMETED